MSTHGDPPRPPPLPRLPLAPPEYQRLSGARGREERLQELAESYGTMAADLYRRIPLYEQTQQSVVDGQRALRGDFDAFRLDVFEGFKKLELRLAPNGEIEQRAARASGHALEEAAAKLGVAAEKLEEITDHGQKVHKQTDSERLRKIAAEQDEFAELRRKATAHDEMVKGRRDMRRHIIAGVAVALIVTAITGIWAYAVGHASGRAVVPAQH